MCAQDCGETDGRSIILRYRAAVTAYVAAESNKGTGGLMHSKASAWVSAALAVCLWVTKATGVCGSD